MLSLSTAFILIYQILPGPFHLIGFWIFLIVFSSSLPPQHQVTLAILLLFFCLQTSHSFLGLINFLLSLWILLNILRSSHPTDHFPVVSPTAFCIPSSYSHPNLFIKPFVSNPTGGIAVLTIQIRSHRFIFRQLCRNNRFKTDVAPKKKHFITFCFLWQCNL